MPTAASESDHRGAGWELPKRWEMAMARGLETVHSSPSWRPGIVTSLPWSSPVRAASTISSVDVTIDGGSFCHGRPAISQMSVAVAPGSTAWTRMPLSASSCRSEWVRART
jgi:hypothetical protein